MPSAFFFRPHHLALFAGIDIQDLTGDTSTPALTRQEQYRLRDVLGRHRFLKRRPTLISTTWQYFPSNLRSLSIKPKLLRVFSTLLLKLLSIYRPRSHSIYSSPYQHGIYQQPTCHSPRTRPCPCNITHQAPHKPKLHGALPSSIIGITPLSKMPTLTPNNNQAHVLQALLPRSSKIPDLPQPRPRSQERALNIYSMRSPPLIDAHIRQTLMTRQNREIETGERDAASHWPEFLGRRGEGYFEGGFGGDVAGDELECFVVGQGGRLGSADIETGDERAGGEESGDSGGANEACSSCYQDVSSCEVERQIHDLATH